MKEDGEIHAKWSGGTLEYAALPSQMKSAIDSAIISAFNSHTHLSAAPGAPTGPPVIPMTAPPQSAYSSKGVKIS